jgi:hypothetical protein
MGLRKFSELKKLLNEITILLKVALNAIKQTNFNLNITEVSSSIDKSKINYLLDHLCNIFSNSAKITLINFFFFFFKFSKTRNKNVWSFIEFEKSFDKVWRDGRNKLRLNTS